MYKSSEFTKSFYKPQEVADLFGLSAQTIRNRIAEGEIGCSYTEGGHRIISRKSLLKYLDDSNMLLNDDKTGGYDVVYARVSSHEQKMKGDLDRQVSYIVESIGNLNNVMVLKEVGSGLNDRRKQLRKLIKMVMNDEVHKVYITYKDRLTRFGYHYLEDVFLAKGVEIVITGTGKGMERSVYDELVEDMMSLIASFSGKLYGMRSHKSTKIKQEEQT